MSVYAYQSFVDWTRELTARRLRREWGPPPDPPQPVEEFYVRALRLDPETARAAARIPGVPLSYGELTAIDQQVAEKRRREAERWHPPEPEPDVDDEPPRMPRRDPAEHLRAIHRDLPPPAADPWDL